MSEEKSEERKQQEKAALDAMKHAKANMEMTLRRIDSLESTVRNAVADLNSYLKYLPEGAYLYSSDKQIRDSYRKELETLRKLAE